MRRLVAIAGLAIGLAALSLQFFLMVSASLGEGKSLPDAVVYYFSFFTILSNALLVLVYLGAVVRGQRWLALFRKPITRAVAASAIALVGAYYHFVLAGLYELVGLIALCTLVLHYVTPTLYVLWYAVWNRTGTLKWASVPVMLAYPLVYLAVVLARGALTGEYPYPTFDAGALGYARVALNAGSLLVFLLVLNAVAVAIDRSLLFGRRS